MLLYKVIKTFSREFKVMTQQSFEDRVGTIWKDGKFGEWKQCKIHMLTHALHYGSSVFEGVRVYNYKPFKLKEHIDRLHKSANILHFEIPYSVDELMSVTNEVIKQNDIKNGYLRPIAWRGTETMLISGYGTKVHTAIAGWAAFEVKRSELRERGIKLHISKWRKPAADASPFAAKSASIYTLSTIAKIDSEKAGFDDALMLDGNGNVTEGTTSNIFFIFNNELHTPIADCFLNGITRQAIIAMSKNLGIPIYERHIKAEEISKADAAFLTGTAIELMPVSVIDSKEFQINHPLIKRVEEEFQKLTMNG